MLVGLGLVAACGGPSAGSLPPDEWNRVLEEMRPDWEPAEVEAFLTRCLDEGGVTSDYEIKLSSSGYTVSGQNVTEADTRVVETCIREATDRFPSPRATSPEQLSVRYDLLLREADCLEEQGFDVDRPSREEFIDSGGTWIPFDSVPGPEEFERVEEICPQDIFAYAGD